MSQALFLTVMGMTIVYLVLALIYGSIRILGWFEGRIPALAATAAVPTPESATGSTSSLSPEEEAAIHAAIAHHTGRAPESFQTRISPDKKES